MYRYTEAGAILRESDGAHIPCDESNRDYRKILESGVEIAPFVAPVKPSKELTLAQVVDLVDYLMTGDAPAVEQPGPPSIRKPEEMPEMDTLLFDAPASDEETLRQAKAQLEELPDDLSRDRLILGMSAADRHLLSEQFRKEVNEMTNRKIQGVRLNEFDEAQYQRKLGLYHALAQKGDGS